MRITKWQNLIFAGVISLFILNANSQVWDSEDGIEPSFYIQGEYYGAFDLNPDVHVAATVRGEGGDQFRVTFLAGGLVGPTDYNMGGWDNTTNSPRTIFTFNYGNGTMNMNSGLNEWSGTLTIPGDVKTASDDQKIIKGKRGSADFTLQRVQRYSPTTDWAPPVAARVLFDGTEQSFDDNWNLTSGGRYDATRSAIYRGVDSKYLHKDGFFHVEYIQPYRPSASGQARANSGIYLKHVYEAQITDPFGIDGIAHNEAGGLYGKVAPLVNASFPVLRWVTYDIHFTDAKYSGQKTDNAKFTVYLNGILVHDDSEMDGPGTGGRTESNSPGPLFLQAHSNPVYFRNVWMLEGADMPTPQEIKTFIENPVKGCGISSSPAYDADALWPSQDPADCQVEVQNKISNNFSMQTHQNQGKVTLDVNIMTMEKVTFTITDIQGKTIKIFSNKNPVIKLDLGFLESGMYLIKIHSKTRQFVKNFPVL